MVNMSSAKQQTAGELLIDLAKIQQARGAKRKSLLAEARKRWAGHQWGSEEMTRWARWSWGEATKGI